MDNKYYDLLREIIKLINIEDSFVERIPKILNLVKDSIGMEAVGMRLRNGFDFPYYVTKGFPAYFVESENFLCSYDQYGEIERDFKGNPIIECMCGNVICGRTSPSYPFFTPFGSFWSNCTTQLLATTTDEDRQARTRNRCNSEGYESVALIPLKIKNEIVGLLQLNDKRKNMFTLDMINQMEDISLTIGVIFSQKEIETFSSEISKKEKERNRELNCLYNISNIKNQYDTFDEIYSKIMDTIPNAWENPGKISLALNIFNKTYFSHKYQDKIYKKEYPVNINKEKVGTLKVYFMTQEELDFNCSDNNEKNNFIYIITENIAKITQRKLTEDSLKKSKMELETRVYERTKEISEINKILEASLSDKEILMKEIHHRVKNNFSIIISLLELGSAGRKNQECADIMNESINRLRTMSLIHERLYQSDDFKNIDFSTYLSFFITELYGTVKKQDREIQLVFDIEENIKLTVNHAITCSLIINEILTNSFKYAFPQSWTGKPEVKIAMNKNIDNEVKIKINDNGIGIPENTTPENTDTLGLTLIFNLIKQLNGNIKLFREKGTEFQIFFHV
jgi:two-component sensor histidine kinase